MLAPMRAVLSCVLLLAACERQGRPAPGSVAPDAALARAEPTADAARACGEDVLAALGRYVEARVVEGFETREDIVEGAIEVEAAECFAPDLSSRVAAMTDRALEAQRQRESTWTEPTDCDRLDAAFAELERNGILARQHFEDCQTCGHGMMREEVAAAVKAGRRVAGYTFYHFQDTEAAAEGAGVWLAFDAAKKNGDDVAVGRRIAATLRRWGLDVRWDGSAETRINAAVDWRRRRFTPSPPVAPVRRR